MSFTLQGHGDHYVKRVMQWCRGWVRTGCVTYPFGIHFDIGVSRPSPSNVNLQNERPVCMSFTFEGHGDNYLKIVIQWCRGWVRTGSVCFIIKQL
jgi:hypothetical protein